MEGKDDFEHNVSYGISEDTPPPADIRDAMDRRRAEWLDSLREMEQIQREHAPTPEEVQSREELIDRIFEKLGIRPEVEEWKQLMEARSRRREEVQSKYFRTEDQ
jgi:aryl carrier-like protein